MSDDRQKLQAYLEGELPPEEAKALEARLQSGELAEALEEERAFLEQLRRPDPRAAQVDVLPKVRARLNRKRPPWLPMAAGLVVVAIAYPLWQRWLPDQGPSAIRAKSLTIQQRWTGIHIYQASDPQQAAKTAEVMDSISADTSLIFGYSNADVYRYLMIFGQDASGEIRWYHPAYTSAAQDPEAIPARANVRRALLPDQISHELAQGPMTVYGLFLKQPMRVKSIEALLQRKALGDLKDAYIQKVRLKVRLEVQ